MKPTPIHVYYARDLFAEFVEASKGTAQATRQLDARKVELESMRKNDLREVYDVCLRAAAQANREACFAEQRWWIKVGEFVYDINVRRLDEPGDNEVRLAKEG